MARPVWVCSQDRVLGVRRELKKWPHEKVGDHVLVFPLKALDFEHLTTAEARQPTPTIRFFLFEQRGSPPHSSKYSHSLWVDSLFTA